MKTSILMTLVILIVVGLALAGLLVFQWTNTPVSETPQPTDACTESGGTQREFPNSCVDSCELERNPETISCAYVLTQGCDCGPNRCWNGQACEDN